MSSSYLNQYRLSLDPEFHGVVRQALIATAIDIRAEDPETPHHEKRRFIADQVYANTAAAESIVQTFVRLCSSNPKIAGDAVIDGKVLAANVEDTDVAYVIAANWDGIANGTL